MIEIIFEGFIKITGRIIGQILIDLIFEIIIKGPGYFIVNLFTVEKPDTDSFTVIASGFLFWVAIGFGGYSTFSMFWPTV